MEEVRLCECGCGQPAPISLVNSKKRGLVKGKPMRFFRNHSRWKEGDRNPNWKGGIIEHGQGYLMMRCPEHPRANGIGYVYLHRIKAEKALGKPLSPQAVVHHHGEEELVICEDNAYHLFLHRRIRSLRDCGHANWRKCKICKKYDDPMNLVIHSRYKESCVYHLSCINQYTKTMRLRRQR